jgi:hypothetical protein
LVEVVVSLTVPVLVAGRVITMSTWFLVVADTREIFLSRVAPRNTLTDPQEAQVVARTASRRVWTLARVRLALTFLVFDALPPQNFDEVT